MTAAPHGGPWHGHWRRRWRHSLRWRLVGLFVLLALATTLIFSMGMRSALSAGWRDAILPLVADYLDRLATEVGSPPDVARAQALTERLPLALAIEGPVVNWRSGTLWVEDHTTGRSEWLVRHSADGHRLRFALDPEGWLSRPRHIGWLTLALLLALTALAWRVVHHLLAPLHDLGAGAQRFGQGQFSPAIPVRRDDELGALARQLNTMAADLAALLEAKRALLLAISHELRSPLTRARLNAELVADGPERDALLRDLAAMRDLIADLLESERLAQPHATLLREPVDMVALLADVLAALPDGVAPQCQIDPALPLGWVDRSRIGLLLRNLLDNAWRHAGAAGPGAGADGRQASPPSGRRPPELRLTWQPGQPGQVGQLDLVLRDHGPGVPPDQLARLAEPFHRTDAARLRSTGGVGLGLYLCRLVAQAHGGRLDFANAADGGSGLVVHLSLPWPPVPDQTKSPAPGQTR